MVMLSHLPRILWVWYNRYQKQHNKQTAQSLFIFHDQLKCQHLIAWSYWTTTHVQGIFCLSFKLRHHVLPVTLELRQVKLLVLKFCSEEGTSVYGVKSRLHTVIMKSFLLLLTASYIKLISMKLFFKNMLRVLLVVGSLLDPFLDQFEFCRFGTAHIYYRLFWFYTTQAVFQGIMSVWPL